MRVRVRSARSARRCGPGVDMSEHPELTTEIASHDLHHIRVRGFDLTSELMGRVTFTDMVFLLIAERIPDDDERALLDAVLVSLVEHGLTPSAVVARVTAAVAPEALQGAVAAGLLGAGSLVLGSMEECGLLLERIETGAREAGGDADTAFASHARTVVAEYRQQRRPVPGLGHAIHTEGDPRTARLLDLAAAHGRRGRYVAALECLAAEAEAAVGKRLPINATGAIAAVLLELGVPSDVHRGFALVSRAPGLVAHIAEERTRPITPELRRIFRAQGGA